MSPNSSALNSCCSFLCSETRSGAFDELLTKGVVGNINRRPDDEIPDLCGEFSGEGSDDVVEFGALGGDKTHPELGFHLLKPHFRVDDQNGGISG